MKPADSLGYYYFRLFIKSLGCSGRETAIFFIRVNMPPSQLFLVGLQLSIIVSILIVEIATSCSYKML